MPRTCCVSTLWWLAGPLLVALACSHDSPRDNPLDPTLTPPVELQVALDDTAGTATLTWTQYEGEAEFAEYWVLRNVLDRATVDTLAMPSERDSTSYVDTSISVGVNYVYRVSVHNAGRLEAVSNQARVRPLALPPVKIESLEFDSRTASAGLEWTRYRGPRFQSYRVQRRTDTEGLHTIVELGDSTVTTHLDTGLLGDTQYHYQVVVAGEGGEEVASQESSGSFHELVETWYFPETRHIRLARGIDGDVVATLIQPRLPKDWQTVDYFAEIWLAVFGDDGPSVQSMATVIDDLTPLVRAAGFAATTTATDGTPLIGFYDDQTGAVEIRELDGETARSATQHLVLRESLSPAPDALPGEVALETETELAAGQWESLSVTPDGGQQVFDDFQALFDGLDLEGFATISDTTAQGWEFRGSAGAHENGITMWGASGSAARHFAGDWQQVQVQAEFYGYWDMSDDLRMALRIGSEAGPFARLWVTRQGLSLELAASSLGAGAPTLTSVPTPWVLIPRLYYRAELKYADGVVEASLTGPLAFGVAAPGGMGISMVGLGVTIALVVDDVGYALGPGGKLTDIGSLDTRTTELRTWEHRGRTNAGVAQPDARRVLLGIIPTGREGSWTTYMMKALGPTISPREGLLGYPSSFDVGPDGRVFVLDAVHSHVFVFDDNNRYVTKFGGRGDGAGEFNLGTGATSRNGDLDLSGSVAVDDEGYIYVADEQNKRVQKFAP